GHRVPEGHERPRSLPAPGSLASPEQTFVDVVSSRTLFIASLALAGAAHAQLAGIATRDGVPTLAPLLEKVTPAVVNIAVLQKSPDEQNPLLSDPFFRQFFGGLEQARPQIAEELKSTRLNSSHLVISYAVFCLKKKNNKNY